MANITREIRRILGGIVQWGFTGFNLKNSGTTAQFRNATDSGWADVEVENVFLHGSNGTFKVIIDAPAGLASDVTVVLPAGGTVPTSTGMHVSKIIAFTQASSTTLSLDTAPPANATLAKVRVCVDTAAAGGAPSIQVGISGTPGLYHATTDNDLKQVGQYITEPFIALGGTPGAIIATISVSAQTFIGRIELEYVLA